MQIPLNLLLKSLPAKLVIKAILDFLEPYVLKKVQDSKSALDDKAYEIYLLIKKELLK